MFKEQYQVKVTNNNDVTFNDMYDGIPYVFKADESVNIPYIAACHIFGVDFSPEAASEYIDKNESIFRHLQRRWGWNRPSELESNRKLFDNLEFKLIALAVVERTVQPEELAEPRRKKASLSRIKHNESNLVEDTEEEAV